MKCLLVTIAWMISCFSASALVHYVKLEKGQNGCKSPKGTEMAVGDIEQDDKTCGAYTCQSKEGDAFVHFCQIPATFAECVETAVLTDVDFPQCCWTCAAWTKCGAGSDGAAEGGEGAPDGGTAEGAEGEAAPAEGSRSADKPTKAPTTTTTVAGETTTVGGETTPEGGKPRTKGKGGSKRSTTKPAESDFPEENINIKFGGGSPISKFGEDSI
ncbi:hypothetical protein KR084_000958 [Drosophila pseudotakahashii]|nr:hypothetical protein KR084_000958 [Drosophila pseudotakahashii]